MIGQFTSRNISIASFIAIIAHLGLVAVALN